MQCEAVSELSSTQTLFAIDATARRLGGSSWTLRRKLNDGQIKSVRIGNRRLIPISEIARIEREGLS